MFEYTDVPDKIQQLLYTEGSRDYIKVLYNDPNPVLSDWHPEPCFLIRKYKQFAEQIRSFPVYDDDTWIITYPKCGTTWTQEMVWLLSNDMNYEKARKVNLNQRSPYMEISSIGSNLPFNSVENAKNVPRPRLIKSHLPLNLLPQELWTKNPKIIYVARNPMDAAISYYHHYRMILGFTGSIEDFLTAFLDGNLIYGSYFRHVDEFLRLKSIKPNIFFCTFEEMKRDMQSVLAKTSQYLGKSYSQDELIELENHLKFDKMKVNPSCNNEEMTKSAMDMNGRKGEQFSFLRKGQVGTYREEMPAEYVSRFEDELQAWDNIRHTFSRFL